MYSQFVQFSNNIHCKLGFVILPWQLHHIRCFNIGRQQLTEWWKIAGNYLRLFICNWSKSNIKTIRNYNSLKDILLLYIFPTLFSSAFGGHVCLLTSGLVHDTQFTSHYLYIYWEQNRTINNIYTKIWCIGGKNIAV